MPEDVSALTRVGLFAVHGIFLFCFGVVGNGGGGVERASLFFRCLLF